jgi:hypothetical protein
VAPERVVEIGALRGDTTASLLESLGAEAQLHVIDPVPQFDPEEHARRFAGRYVFHRDTSLRVLPKLEAVDVALIDGDHNWYTVSNELRMLHARAEAAGRPGPVVVLHDVCWPYGRRDGYYAPKRIPRKFRHPNAQLGLERGFAGLRPVGGVNRNIWNANLEGGARNGVLTAVEDFLTEHPASFRLVVLELYSGLAVVSSTDRIARHRDLAGFLDRLGTAEEQARVGARAEAVVREAVASGTLKLT